MEAGKDPHVMQVRSVDERVVYVISHWLWRCTMTGHEAGVMPNVCTPAHGMQP